MNEEELIRETRKLIGRWDNVRIVGQGWAGDARRGFQFNPIRTTTGAGGGGPTPPTGACCPEDGDCFISTQSVCESGGGTYQGDGTTCDPDPCPPKGACCVGTDCTIETEDDCTGMGGTYQGDDTTCDPNPCGTEPECPCGGYVGFLGGGNYLTKTQVKTYNQICRCCRPDVCRAPLCSGVWTRVWNIDPDTCIETLVSETGFNFSCIDCAYPPECYEHPETCPGGDCTGVTFLGNMDLVLDCATVPVSDTNAHCSKGWSYDLVCPGIITDCSLHDDGGTDYNVTEDITYSNPCTPV